MRLLSSAPLRGDSAVKLSALLDFTGQMIIVKEKNEKVYLICGSHKEVIWFKDKQKIANTTELDLGAMYDDPRGTYACEKGTDRFVLQVYYRSKCQKPCF